MKVGQTIVSNGVSIHLLRTSYGGDYADRYTKLDLNVRGKIYLNQQLWLRGDRKWKGNGGDGSYVEIEMGTISSKRLPDFHVCVDIPFEPTSPDEDTTSEGKIELFKFKKDHKNKIGIAVIKVSGVNWVPIKFYWADGVTEVISIEPGTTDEIGHEIAYAEDIIGAEIDGHPETKIYAEYTSFEIYVVIGLAALIVFVLRK